MQKKVRMTFNGTGAALYFCLGFLPDWVKITGNSATYQPTLTWDRDMLPLQYEGLLEATGTTYIARTPLLIGAGVSLYVGGDILTAANQTSVAYGAGVYLVKDGADYRQDLTLGVQAPIDVNGWKLGNSSNRTGNFSSGILASGSRIGVGSKVIVKAAAGARQINPEQEAIITAISNQGAAANEVTLSKALPTGDVVFIGGQYTSAPMALGRTTMKGILLNAITPINISNEVHLLEAGYEA